MVVLEFNKINTDAKPMSCSRKRPKCEAKWISVNNCSSKRRGGLVV